MYLLINTSAKDSISLTLFKGSFVEQKSYSAVNRDLLLSINSFLEVNKLSVQAIKGLVVVVGTGSFTSTRIATTVANTWAYSEKIPILAVGVKEITDLVSLEEKISQSSVGILILAIYSAEPNIGKKK